MRVTGAPPALTLSRAGSEIAAPQGQCVSVAGCEQLVPVLQRTVLVGTDPVPGPAVILDMVSTTWLAPDWTARSDALNTLHLERR